ncbi:MAG: ATP-binding cassette domain-containing protein [Chitinophagales bacterium]
MIHIQSLRKSYGKNQVLKNINLSFHRGEINGIVGENGAGKTTFFKCMASLEHFEGKIEYDKGILKNHLGFLPTNPFFLSKITGYEYLQLLCNARNVKVKSWGDNNIFNLPLNQFADTYSTGMKKKLAFTATLLQQNDVFILDEPFNGVDIQSNMVIQEVLKKLKQLNKIILLSSHIFSTLSESCDVLHHLKEGRIVRSVEKKDFKMIEEGLIDEGIGKKIDTLDIR